MSAGTYNATVEVSCPNAANSPQSYRVTLDVSEAPRLTSMRIEPFGATFFVNESMELTARPLDQNGGPFPAAIVWSTSGGGSLTPDTSGSEVAEHVTTFRSDGTAGHFTVRAESGQVEASVRLIVLDPSQLYLKVNCGDNGFTPAGWENDDAYATGGSDHVFPETFDVNGVQDAADPDVYKTCRHRIEGAETSFGYDFPTVSDGPVTLRLHFGDSDSSRSIDVWVEDQEVVSDLDISTRAGGAYRALVLELRVQVGGGDGLQIRLSDDQDDPGDFLINGIEVVTSGPNLAPEVDAGPDLQVILGTPVFLIGTAEDDLLPHGELTTSWSVVSGPAAVDIEDPAALSTVATFHQVGEYELRLTADDGELQTHDDLNVVIDAQPQIALHTPNGGELLIAGTVHHVSWTTVNLYDVQLDYSVDGGQTWTNIIDSLDSSKPHWQHYPWEVPDVSSDQCLFRIEGYDGEDPTVSEETFTILSKEDARNIVVAGSCSHTTPGETVAVWALLAALTCLRRLRGG
jgi:hypothetical protein